MKKHLFIIALLTSFLGFSQGALPIDFDSAVTAYGDGGAAFAVTASPDDAGDNVGEIVANGGSYENIQIDIPTGNARIDLTGSNTTISFDFYSTTTVPGLVKLEGELNNYYPIELGFTPSGAGWETISLDFATASNSYPNHGIPSITLGQYAKLVVFPDFGVNSTGTYYIDDIAGGDAGTAVGADAAPAGSASAPTADAADVISIYSDSYTSDKPASFNGFSGGVVANEVEVAANDTVIKYSNMSWVGFDLANQIDASSMTHVSFDVWSADASSIELKLVDWGADGVWASAEDAGVAGADNSEHGESADITSASTWQTVSFPIDYFTTDGAMSSDTNIAQVVFIGTASSTVYLDNLHFSYDASYTYVAPIVDAPTSAAAAPTASALDVISIFSDSYTDIGTSEWNPGWGQNTVMSLEEIAANDTIIKYENLNYTGIVTDYGNPTDLSGMTHVHFDYFTGSATSVGFKMVSTDNGQENEQSVGTVTTGSWQTADIALSDFATGNPLLDLSIITQLLFTGNATVYIDNLYFYTDSPVLAPTSGPSAPTADAADVISLFSDSYTDVSIGTFSPEWDGADVADYAAGADNTKQYSNFGWSGIVVDNNYSSFIDASSMTHVNFSVWSRDLSSINFKIVDIPTGSEHELTVSNTAGQWSSFSIALTEFTGLTSLSGVGQLFFSGGTGTDTFFLDDLYFSTEGASTPPPTEVVPSAAPAVPTHAAEAVYEVYSDSYSNNGVLEWNPGWGQSTTQSELVFDGNSILLYENFNYQGIQLTAVDLSAATHVSYDYFSPAVGGATSIGLSVINTTSGNGVIESVVIEAVSTQDAWASVNTPLSSYTTEMTAVDQLKWDQGTGGKFYVDNLIFYNAGGTTLNVGGVSAEATVVSPNPTSGVINVTGDVYSVSGQKVLSNTNDLSGLPSGIYFVRANGSTSKVIKK